MFFVARQNIGTLHDRMIHAIHKWHVALHAQL